MKKIILLAMLCFGVVSCEKWFDVSPKSEFKAEDLFSTVEGFEDALTGVYSVMTTPDSYGVSLTYGLVDVLAQYYEIPSTSTFNDEANYRLTVSSESGQLAKIWNTHYLAIANLNAMFEHIDVKKEMLGKSYPTIKGQALALRAYLHFDILRLFAPSFKMGKDLPAIPYMSQYTNVVRDVESVEVVLNKIIKDLNEARDLMRSSDIIGPNFKYDLEKDEPEEIESSKIYMSYYGATALLSRVSLYAEKYNDALSAAKEIIGEANGFVVPIFEMTTGVTNPLFKDEVIFWLDKGNMKDEISPYFSDEAAASYNKSGSKYLRMKLSVKTNVYSTMNPTDVEYRKDLWFKTAGTVATYVTLSKYNTVEKMPMLRLSELFLIAAESATDEREKLAYLNRLKSYRGLNPVSEVGNEIEKEYTKEFVGEGQLFFYYKRNNKTKIGVSKSVTIDPNKVYKIALPLDEQDFSNK